MNLTKTLTPILLGVVCARVFDVLWHRAPQPLTIEVVLEAKPVEPIPTTVQYAIVRIDMYHLNGVLEGVYPDATVAGPYLDALRNVANTTDSFLHSVRAKFLLMKVVNEKEEAATPVAAS